MYGAMGLRAIIKGRRSTALAAQARGIDAVQAALERGVGKLIEMAGISGAHSMHLEAVAQPPLAQARSRAYGGTRPAFSGMT